MSAPESDEPLVVERHRPERWWDGAVVGGICCSCCCCCCCCLHSVGAAAGAVAGSIGSVGRSKPEGRGGVLAATVAYWAGVGLASLGSIIAAFFMDGTLVVLIALAFLAPALQLFGTFFALPAILLQPTSARRRAAAGAIGSATLGSFLGGVLGGLLMAFGGGLIALVWAAA